jgi:hypothetical protein
MHWWRFRHQSCAQTDMHIVQDRLQAGLVLVLVTMLLFLVGGLVAGGGQEEKRLKNETSTNPVFASGDASHGFFSGDFSRLPRLRCHMQCGMTV